MDCVSHQTTYWNNVAWTKTFSHAIDFPRFEAYVRRSDSILDLGCGYGRILNDLHERGYKHLTGLDPAEKMIERGSYEFPHLNLRVLHRSSIPAAEGSLDTVIMFAVLGCIPADSEQRNVIREVSRVLCPGGILYIADFPFQEDRRNIERYDRFSDKYDAYGTFELPGGAVLRHLDFGWFRQLLSQFECVEMFQVDVTTMNANPARGFQYFGRKKDAGV